MNFPTLPIKPIILPSLKTKQQISNKMKKITSILAMLLIISSIFSQSKLVTHRGGIELFQHEIVKPDMTGFSIYDMIENGYWNGSRVLDYDSLNMTYKGNWPLGLSYSMSYTGSNNIFLVGSAPALLCWMPPILTIQLNCRWLLQERW